MFPYIFSGILTNVESDKFQENLWQAQPTVIKNKYSISIHISCDQLNYLFAQLSHKCDQKQHICTISHIITIVFSNTLTNPFIRHISCFTPPPSFLVLTLTKSQQHQLSLPMCHLTCQSQIPSADLTGSKAPLRNLFHPELLVLMLRIISLMTICSCLVGVNIICRIFTDRK